MEVTHHDLFLYEQTIISNTLEFWC